MQAASSGGEMTDGTVAATGLCAVFRSLTRFVYTNDDERDDGRVARVRAELIYAALVSSGTLQSPRCVHWCTALTSRFSTVTHCLVASETVLFSTTKLGFVAILVVCQLR